MKWAFLLKQVDLLAATLEAGNVPQPDLLEGLAVPAVSKIPPNLLCMTSAERQ